MCTGLGLNHSILFVVCWSLVPVVTAKYCSMFVTLSVVDCMMWSSITEYQVQYCDSTVHLEYLYLLTRRLALSGAEHWFCCWLLMHCCCAVYIPVHVHLVQHTEQTKWTARWVMVLTSRQHITLHFQNSSYLLKNYCIRSSSRSKQLHKAPPDPDPEQVLVQKFKKPK